jgi:hypothetical protein
MMVAGVKTSALPFPATVVLAANTCVHRSKTREERTPANIGTPQNRAVERVLSPSRKPDNRGQRRVHVKPPTNTQPRQQAYDLHRMQFPATEYWLDRMREEHRFEWQFVTYGTPRPVAAMGL